MTMNNSSLLAAALLSALLLTTAGCAGSAKTESAGEYVDDVWITTRVKALLIDDPLTKSYEINVETFKGVVQLSGFVSSRAAIDQALRLSRDVKGVSSVTNKMTVK